MFQKFLRCQYFRNIVFKVHNKSC